MSYLKIAYEYGCNLAQEDFKKEAQGGFLRNAWKNLRPAEKGAIKQVGAGAGLGGLVGGFAGGEEGDRFNLNTALLGANLGGAAGLGAGILARKNIRKKILDDLSSYAETYGTGNVGGWTLEDRERLLKSLLPETDAMLSPNILKATDKLKNYERDILRGGAHKNKILSYYD